MKRALVALGVALLVVVHAVVVHHLSSRFSWPLLFIAPLVAFVVAKHVGLFAALHERLRPRP